MKPKAKRLEKRRDLYADGSLKAIGSIKGGKLHGHWKWYRENGVIMRSGYFDHGVQVGRWVTYDQAGNEYKVTEFDRPRK